MNHWSAPKRPAEYAEKSLVTAILNRDYPPGSSLPAERELAALLGVTRPTLRETLKKLERDGWLTIQQGKSTRVNDFWKEGGLNVLNALVEHSEILSPNFVPNLLYVRLVLAPAYTRLAVENSPGQVQDFLEGAHSLGDTPEEYSAYDWQLHHMLTTVSGNPIFTLILNGFAGLYKQMATRYFQQANARKASHEFYQLLNEATKANDALKAETITRDVMSESIRLWEAQPGGAA